MVEFRVTPGEGGDLQASQTTINKQYAADGAVFTEAEIRSAVTGVFAGRAGFRVVDAQEIEIRGQAGQVLNWNLGSKELEIRNAGQARYTITFGAPNYKDKDIQIDFKVTKGVMSDKVVGKVYTAVYADGETYHEGDLLGMIEGEPAGASINKLMMGSGNSVAIVGAGNKSVTHKRAGSAKVKVDLEHRNYENREVEIYFNILSGKGNQASKVELSSHSEVWGTGIDIKNYNASKYEYGLIPDKTEVRINKRGVIEATTPYEGVIWRRIKKTQTHGASGWSDTVNVEFTKQEQGELEIAVPGQSKPWNSGGVQLSLVRGKKGTGNGTVQYEKVLSDTTALGAGVTSAGVVTASGPGDVVVKATKHGDARYNAKESKSVTVKFAVGAFSSTVQGRTERVAYKAGETYDETALLGFVDHEPPGTSIASIRVSGSRRSVKVDTQNKTVSHAGVGKTAVEVELQNPKYSAKVVTITFEIQGLAQKKPDPVRLSQSKVTWGTDVRITDRDYDTNKYEYQLNSTGGVKRNGKTISAKGGPGTATFKSNEYS